MAADFEGSEKPTPRARWEGLQNSNVDSYVLALPIGWSSVGKIIHQKFSMYDN